MYVAILSVTWGAGFSAVLLLGVPGARGHVWTVPAALLAGIVSCLFLAGPFMRAFGLIPILATCPCCGERSKIEGRAKETAMLMGRERSAGRFVLGGLWRAEGGLRFFSCAYPLTATILDGEGKPAEVKRARWPYFVTLWLSSFEPEHGI